MKKTSDKREEIPCLASHCLDPLHHLEEQLLASQSVIEAWLREQWRKTLPPFYASVDLRNAGFKLAPVDTNLFPAGFNNLKEDFIPLAVQAAQETLDRLAPACRRLLLIPENHTRNQYYFKNLLALHDILIQAGFEVRIGSLLEDIENSKEILLPFGRSLLLEKVKREGDQIKVNDFLPCLLVLNNDLANGIPKILQGIKQKILPVAELGWHSRLKSDHFREYGQVCEELAQLIKLDPWLINPLFARCEGVDFMKREGEDCMVEKSHHLLDKIQKKYDEYHIKEKPYVVIKADAGTYGMGVLSIHDPAEIRQLNRKKRSDMMVAKGNRPIEQVIIQEGVYTFETWNNAVAEPVVYMIGQYVIGGFYRVHTGRGISDNLNSPGMQFEPLPFVKACNIPEVTTKQKGKCANRFYVYGVIARLALLAAAREQAAVLKKEG
ncbi:MAG: glutamate--cysteine ligase [Pseudomonadota bacterium]